MTLERFRTSAPGYRRTSLVDVPSGATLAELCIPANRRGWVVVAHDGAHDPASAVADLNRSGLATFEVRVDGTADAMRLVETVAWLKRSVAEAQGLPVGLLGFGAAASAALSAAAVLGKQLGALVTVNAAPDLAKLRLNGVNTFSLLIADAEHAGVNRHAVQRVRGVSRLEIADGSLSEAARAYGAAWLSGHLGALGSAAPSRGMLTRLMGSWRMPKLWWGAPSRAAAAFLLACGGYFVSAPDAHAAISSNVNAGGVLTVSIAGGDAVTIGDSSGALKINGADPDNGPANSADITAIRVNGSALGDTVNLAGVIAGAFTGLPEIVVDAGDGDDSITGNNDLSSSLIGGPGADFLFSGSGNDTLVARSGDGDLIGSGNGDDLVIFEGGTATSSLSAGIGNDTLRFEGTGGADNLQVTSFGSGFEQVELLGLGGNDTLTSTASSSATVLLIDGGDGDDSVAGPDTGSFAEIDLLGGDGNDTVAAGLVPSSVSMLDGGPGDDSLVGGAGNDQLFDEGSGSTTAEGGGGADTLTITGDSLDNAIDVLVSKVEFSTINGGDGRDTIALGLNVSATTLQIQVNGDGDNDSLLVDGHLGVNLLLTMNGGAGNDTVFASGLNDTISGGPGDDSLMGGEGNDNIFGDNSTGFSEPGGNDILDGGNDNDTLSGGYGDDSILGGAGDDSIFGEKSGDSVGGTLNSADTIDGGTGNDTIEAGEDDDSILGGLDNDSICGDWFNDNREQFAGDDIIDGGDGNDTLFGGALNDTVLGGPGDDVLDDGPFAPSGDDSLVGGTGNDIFLMHPGSDDTVSDIGGLDTLNFSAASLGVRMNLDKKGERQSIDNNDNGLTLFGVFEGWVGSALDDELDLSPLVASRTVDGGTHTGADILTYDQKGFGTTDSGTQLTPTVGGFGVVNYTNFETVTLIDSFDITDIDGDGIPNSLDLDNDNDGIPDSKDPDKDGDGWDDDVEIDAGTDPLDPTDFPADSIVGTSGTDTDGDGIPDEIEDVVGDLDPSTSPGQMSVSKFKGKLKFPAVLKDALAFKTRLALPAGFDPDGAHLIVDIGGVIREFDLDSKGRSDKADRDNKAKLKLLPSKKQTLPGTTLADLQITLKKQDFSGDLSDEGLDNAAPPIESENLVMLFVIVNDAPYQAVKKVLYKNKNGSSGSFKNTKALKELVP